MAYLALVHGEEVYERVVSEALYRVVENYGIVMKDLDGTERFDEQK